MTQELELTVKRTIEASAKSLFEAWLDPKALAEFIRPAPEMSVPEATADPKVGGTYKIVMRAGDKDLVHQGQYKIMDKYTKLAFTWLSDFTIPGSTVTLHFNELTSKKTEVTLHHKGFPNEDSRGNHEGGWTRILEALAPYASKAA